MREPLPEGITEGTVIHGTLRTVDLVSAFAEELKKIAPELMLLKGNLAEIDLAHKMSRTGSDSEYALALGNGNEAKGYEDSGWLLEELFEALESFAPDGWHFGNTEGDGSDFGWWCDEEEDEDG